MSMYKCMCLHDGIKKYDLDSESLALHLNYAHVMGFLFLVGPVQTHFLTFLYFLYQHM